MFCSPQVLIRKPKPLVAATITTVFNQLALLISNDTETTVSFRQVLLTPGLSAATATQARVTIQWGTNATGSALNGMYIGQVGAAEPNFNGNQVPVLWSGGASPTFVSNGQATSDWVTLGEAWDNTKKYMVAWGAAAGGWFKYNDASAGATTCNAYFLDGDGTQYSQTTGSGFTNDTNNHLYFIGKVEVK